MEPIFTVPYAEFCVAEQLAHHFPASKGYSVYVPISRQQPGIDLVLARRSGNQAQIACIQVKSSRVYSPRKPSVRAKRRFRYYTWFNTFECPPQADFFCLVALYPAVTVAQRRELGGWWLPQVLLFTQPEMRRFLRGVKTVRGKRDPMFGFGFSDPDECIQTRGDQHRRYREFTDHLLESRLGLFRKFFSR